MNQFRRRIAGKSFTLDLCDLICMSDYIAAFPDWVSKLLYPSAFSEGFTHGNPLFAEHEQIYRRNMSDREVLLTLKI